ncbi:MAG: hypothetical protein IJA60_03695 [Clostridia bacterium]|nr:hypothetical protein [Clostridia bacterium]
MKLKNVFKLLGLSLFMVALVLFLLSQNPKVDIMEILFPVAFGTVLAFSGACLITGELIGKIDELEKRAFWLEEEVRKLKEKIKTDKE